MASVFVNLASHAVDPLILRLRAEIDALKEQVGEEDADALKDALVLRSVFDGGPPVHRVVLARADMPAVLRALSYLRLRVRVGELAISAKGRRQSLSPSALPYRARCWSRAPWSQPRSLKSVPICRRPPSVTVMWLARIGVARVAAR